MVASGVATAIVGLLGLWAALALWYQVPGGEIVKSLVVAFWAILCGAAILLILRHRPLLGGGGFAIAYLLLLAWWHGIEPTNNRDWSDDGARLATGAVAGNQAIVRNVRNFDWRTNSDYTSAWETRSYDLQRLRNVDLITSYWTGPAIAHVLVSFGFDDGQQVVFSVEIRRDRRQAFSELGGFFKEFELIVIAADERDLVRVRTNVRGEEDYLYHIEMPLEAKRALFRAYLDEANQLATKPRFYNSLTANCTTIVYHMMRGIVGHLPLDYRLVLSGYLPAYVYKVGGLDPRYTLEQLRAFGRITDRAKAAGDSAQFSQDIRIGIPATAAIARSGAQMGEGAGGSPAPEGFAPAP